MKLIFLGTKGEIEEASPQHKLHTAIMLETGGKKFLFDFGKDWHGRLKEFKPDAIFISHAHADHAGGLEGEEIEIPVYMSEVTDKLLSKEKFPFKDRKIVKESVEVDALRIERIDVGHSVKAPTNGWIVREGSLGLGIFTDVLWVPKRLDTLKKIQTYAGDGSTLYKSIMRRVDDKGQPYGHASVKDQISWLLDSGVQNAIFTHWGKEPVELGGKLQARLEDLAEGKLRVRAAKDGDELEIKELKQVNLEQAEILDDVELFKVEGYDPSRVTDAQLGDDWRLVAAKYSTLKKGGTISEFKTIEDLYKFSERVLKEILDRGKITFYPEEQKPLSKELLIESLKRLIKRGVYLVSPHAEMIFQGKKKAIVKSKRFELNKFHYLCSDDFCFGFIRTKEPIEIGLKEFAELKNMHKVSDEERRAWWKNKPLLFYYEVRDFIPFDKPRKFKREPGVQTFIQEVKFLQEIDFDKIEPGILKDLSNDVLIALHAELHRRFHQMAIEKGIESEPIVNAHAFVKEEMHRRGLTHTQRTRLDELTEKLKGIRSQAKRYYLKDIMPKFQDFLIDKNIVALTGSLVVSGFGRDIDLISRKTLDRKEQFRIREFFPSSWQEDIHFSVDEEAWFTNHIPLYSKKMELIKEPTIIKMQRELSRSKFDELLVTAEAVRQAEISKKQDRLEYFRFFHALKGIAGYRKLETYSIKGLLEVLKKEKYPYIIDQKYDGARCLCFKRDAKVVLQSEDGGIWTERFPTIVKELQSFKDNFILDTEITGKDPKTGAHLGRSVVAGYAHAKGPINDDPFRINVFTILMKGTEDLHKKTELDRKKILDATLKDLPHLHIAEWKMATDPKETEDVVKYFSDRKKFLGTEGAMIKASAGIYPLTGMSSDWIKFKIEIDIDAEVIDAHRVKGTDAWNYLCVIKDGKTGKPVPVGRTYNVRFEDAYGKPISVPIGGIIRVAFVNLNRYTDPDTKQVWYNWWAPRAIEYREDKKEPDDTETADRIVKDSLGELGEKPYPQRYKEILKLQKEDFDEIQQLIETGLEEEDAQEKELEIPKEAMDIIDKARKLSIEQIKAVDPPKLPKNFFIMVRHFRGKTEHIDFRAKMNSHLEGYTIIDLPAGVIKEEVDTLTDAKRWEREVKWKFGPEMDPTKHVLAIKKARQPLMWHHILRDVFPPGSVGATRFEPGVFLEDDHGLLWPGTYKAYFREYFLYGNKYFKKRLVVRLLPKGPGWERAGKEELHYECWITKDVIPYLLTRRGRTRKDYIPPQGTSGLSPEFEAAIDKQYRWWEEKLSNKEVLKRMDQAYNFLIEQGILKGRPLGVREKQEAKLIKGEIEFVFQRHWWRGPVVIRGMPVEHWDIRFDFGGDYLDKWTLEEDPLWVEEVPSLRKKCKETNPKAGIKTFRDWMTFEGELPPQTPGNPNKKIPAFIEIIDRGKANIIEDSDLFVHVEFKGKKLKGLYRFKREAPDSPIWVFAKSAKPGEKRLNEFETQILPELILI